MNCKHLGKVRRYRRTCNGVELEELSMVAATDRIEARWHCNRCGADWPVMWHLDVQGRIQPVCVDAPMVYVGGMPGTHRAALGNLVIGQNSGRGTRTQSARAWKRGRA